MQRGFIQVPILIAVIVTAVLGGGTYVAYEASKPSQNASQEPITTTEETQVATTTEDLTEQTDDLKNEVNNENSATDSFKEQIIDSVEEVSDPETRTQTIGTAPKTTTVTLPSGKVVEMDASGNIIRTIKEVSQQVYTTPVPTTQTTTSIQISAINIMPTMATAEIEWQTNKPTESKVFLSGGGVSSKVYNSESGFSTRHSVSIGDLLSNTEYLYEIEAISDSIAEKASGNFRTKERTVSSLDVEFSHNNGGYYFGSNCEPVHFSAYTEDQAGNFLSGVSVTFTNPETGGKTTQITQESNEGGSKVAAARFSYTPQVRFSPNKTQTVHFSAESISTEKTFTIRQTEFEQHSPALSNFDTELWELVDMATTTHPSTSHVNRLRDKGYEKDLAWFSKRAYDSGGTYMYFDPDTGMCI